MQGDVDELNLEVRRRDASLDVVHSEKERVLTRLEQEESELIFTCRLMSLLCTFYYDMQCCVFYLVFTDEFYRTGW